MTNEDGDPGDEHRTRADFDRENPHVECDCRKRDDPETWCWFHRQMWEDEVSDEE